MGWSYPFYYNIKWKALSKLFMSQLLKMCLSNHMQKSNYACHILSYACHMQGKKKKGSLSHEIVVFHYLQESIHFELWGWILNRENHENTQYTICDKYVAYRNSKATC